MKCVINKGLKVVAALIIGVGFFSSVSVDTSSAKVINPNVKVRSSCYINNKRRKKRKSRKENEVSHIKTFKKSVSKIDLDKDVKNKIKKSSNTSSKILKPDTVDMFFKSDSRIVNQNQVRVVIDMRRYGKGVKRLIINRGSGLESSDFNVVGANFTGYVSLHKDMSSQILATNLYINSDTIVYPRMVSWMDVELNSQERELANRINDYRQSLGLKRLPVSKSLTYVARCHTWDGITNNLIDTSSPIAGQGNLHSWSNKGPWKGVVYTRDHKYANLMWSKPSELTEYTGSGYEISVWNSIAITPEKAVRAWKNSPSHNCVMASQGEWAKVVNVMGVSIEGKRANVWFGRADDPAGYFQQN